MPATDWAAAIADWTGSGWRAASTRVADALFAVAAALGMGMLLVVLAAGLLAGKFALLVIFLSFVVSTC